MGSLSCFSSRKVGTYYGVEWSVLPSTCQNWSLLLISVRFPGMFGIAGGINCFVEQKNADANCN